MKKQSSIHPLNSSSGNKTAYGFRKTFVAALIILWAAMPASVFSQDFIKTLSLPSSTSITKNIVRNCGDTGFMCYIETPSQHLFVKANDTMGVVYYTFELPINHYVLDFEIHRDMLFFCGYTYETREGEVGLIGHFSIGDMCNTVNKVYIYNHIGYGQMASRIYAKSFTDLEFLDVCHVQQTPCPDVYVALVGSDAEDNPLIVEAIGPYNNPSNWRFALGRNSASACNEKFVQVEETRNYVVTGGTALNNFNKGICFRAFNKNGYPDFFTNSSIHNKFYRYESVNTITQGYTAYPLNKHFEMAATNIDSIATLSLYKRVTSGYEPQTLYGVLLNVYDIAQTLSQPNINCPYSTYTPRAYNLAGSHISDLLYNTNTKNLYALLTADVPSSGASSVCAFIPYMQATPLIVSCLTIPTTEFCKVDITNYSSACLISGYWSSIISGTGVYHRYPIGSVPKCASKYAIDCNAPEHFRSKEYNYPLDIYRSNFDFSTVTVNCTPMSFNSFCR